ncbi:PP2C family protein-serine/threonine phosphatase [Blastococcus sp. PRF04-17]|uniref:PP2C family protein-serine/threonine phosphatase n=1 Tax=Blastococcus sp. PRF04-17 TaxID=2933797 RepID=UPI001FF45135|nr:PP2C family protein-serine/threonine phosphatase [Blastococcus sp. PRF04-17]UOY00408.1 serine/threonine-protein phosphatase [Blastococcus sp. PRF04-17]
MSRTARVQRALPLAVLVVVIGFDFALGRGQTVLTLAAVSPLLAASALNRRATFIYGVLALATGALLGVYDGLYEPGRVAAGQFIRLVGIALATVAALAACTLRLRQEARIAELSAQAATTEAAVQMAEALQRSLLEELPARPGLRTAVRYQPAARHAEVGGDWYDAFPLPNGETALVIGDVAGHDVPAAATMAQARGMLRGIAQSVNGSPSAVLTALDRAFATLAMPTPVTAVMAMVSSPATSSEEIHLRWSNAGHPPPVLICADGTAELLETPPERLLGVTPDVPRSDHEMSLHRGDTLLLYTDGLVERRDAPLDEGTARLLAQLRRLAGSPLEELCDGLLESLPGRAEDDVVLLAVRLSD